MDKQFASVAQIFKAGLKSEKNGVVVGAVCRNEVAMKEYTSTFGVFIINGLTIQLLAAVKELSAALKEFLTAVKELLASLESLLAAVKELFAACSKRVVVCSAGAVCSEGFVDCFE